MLDVKNNFRNKYSNTKCRGCGQDEETQQHVLETCQTLHSDHTLSVSKVEIFKDKQTELKDIATKIKTAMDKLARIKTVQPAI